MGWSWEALGKRPIFFPVLFLLVGSLVGPRLGLPVWCVWLGAGTSFVVAAWWAPRSGALLLLLAGSAGLGLAAATSTAREGIPATGNHLVEGDVEELQAGVDGDPDVMVLAATRVDGEPCRFRATLAGGSTGLTPGQRILVPARLRPMGVAANAGEHDRSELRRRRGQLLTGAFDEKRLVRLTDAPRWRRWLASAHDSLTRSAEKAIGDRDARGLVLTLAAGERAGLGEELEDAFARSGLAHVLSVSGLHVAVVAFAVFAALRWLLTRRMTRWTRGLDPRALAAPVAIGLVWAYVVYTGLQAPAVRSGVMCTLVLAGWLFRRRSDSLNALAFSLLVMMTFDPATPFELSVQLSFTAVAAMVLLSPPLRAAVPLGPPSPASESGWRLRLLEWREAALTTAVASVAVTLATAPLVLGAFQRVSVAGVLSNVVTLPLSGLLTMASAGAAAVHLASPWAGSLLLTLAGGLAHVFLWLTTHFAELPFAAFPLPAPSPAISACWWFGLGAVALLKGRGRWLSLLSPMALVALILGAGGASDGVDVAFLSVGHGDAVVISSQGHHAVIDGGGVPNGSDTGRRIVVPYLRQRMARRLDLVVLTHAHPDHALGLATTVEEIPTERLWLPAGIGAGPLVDDLLAAAVDAKVEEIEAGDEGVGIGAARVEVLGPPVDRSEIATENDHSIVLLVRHGAVTFLLTGDVERLAERFLSTGPVTVMKAPHHGSDTSSTPELLAQAKPRYVVFCVGKDNRYGFPRADVVRRYEALGSRCFRTDLDGAVTFHSDGKDVTFETFAPADALMPRR